MLDYSLTYRVTSPTALQFTIKLAQARRIEAASVSFASRKQQGLERILSLCTA